MGRRTKARFLYFKKKKMFLQLTAVCEQSEFFAVNILKYGNQDYWFWVKTKSLELQDWLLQGQKWEGWIWLKL